MKSPGYYSSGKAAPETHDQSCSSRELVSERTAGQKMLTYGSPSPES